MRGGEKRARRRERKRSYLAGQGKGFLGSNRYTLTLVPAGSSLPTRSVVRLRRGQV